MGFKQGLIIAPTPEFCRFLEIRSSQIPSTCADGRIVGSNAGRVAGGERFLACDASSKPSCFSILSITSEFSMLAMILTLPPHFSHRSVSILKTRFNLWAGIDARRAARVGGSSDTSALFPLPRLAGVTKARCLLLGANTSWNRVRLTLGFGTSAARRAMKFSGSKIPCRNAARSCLPGTAS